MVKYVYSIYSGEFIADIMLLVVDPILLPLESPIKSHKKFCPRSQFFHLLHVLQISPPDGVGAQNVQIMRLEFSSKTEYNLSYVMLGLRLSFKSN